MRRAPGPEGRVIFRGTHPAHVSLEQQLASFHKKEAALVFGSGFLANMAGLSALIKGLQPVIVYSDSENHNSIVNAIRFARATGHDLRIEKRIFAHNDWRDLQALLRRDAQQEVKEAKEVKKWRCGGCQRYAGCRASGSLDCLREYLLYVGRLCAVARVGCGRQRI